MDAATRLAVWRRIPTERQKLEVLTNATRGWTRRILDEARLRRDKEKERKRMFMAVIATFTPPSADPMDNDTDDTVPPQQSTMH